MDVKERWSVDRSTFPYPTLRALIEGELENLRVGSVVWQARVAHVDPAKILPAPLVASIAQTRATHELGSETSMSLSLQPVALDALQELLTGWVTAYVDEGLTQNVFSATQHVLREADFTEPELSLLREVEFLEK